MATQVVEYSHFTVTVGRDVSVDDTVLGTVGGAIIDVVINKTEESSTQITYEILVLHDATGTNALEYSVREFTKTSGTDAQDVSFRTNAGAAMGSCITPLDGSEGKTDYQILIVHLNA